ncbi:hypothetical protein [Costertonia aggregata]|uniref:Alpha/beta hydrolase n=1 Tax=Costertonia aggregata TaxID=343403 RepID=A0A7H9APN0_9FLAO|nr:hypothetical protein [Costertonia aggregata]QLG45377.1 hypothetical protein HYG79_08460 [Costertonia aggregata]
MKGLHFILALFIFSVSRGQIEYAKSVILDSIPISNNTSETFALYLPAKYEINKPSPVVFIFDPSARGKAGLISFLKASEKYGYILIGSNTTKNGPYDKNIEVAVRLFDHVFSNFKVDSQQVFLSGFSGGSRLASRIALLSDDITGVVACGAGFPNDVGFMPRTSKFLYAGICGNRDMNYSEMMNLHPFLKSIGQPYTIFTYDGDHTWPPSEEIVKAFDWLTVQLHKKGKIPLTPEGLKEYYGKEYTTAIKAKNDTNVLQSVEDFERIQSTYKDLYETDSIQELLTKIKKNKLYKATLNSLEKALEAEKALTQKYVDRISSDLDELNENNLKWWAKELEKLKKKYFSGDEEIQKMIHRLRFKVFAYLYSRANTSLATEVNKAQLRYSRKIIELLKATSPKNN